MKPYKRGEMYWGKIRWPGHPEADKEGRLRRPLSVNKGEAVSMLADMIIKRDQAKKGFAPNDTTWKTFKTRYENHLKANASYTTKQAHLRAIREIEKQFPGIEQVGQVTPGLLDEISVRLSQEGKGRYVRVKIIKSIKALMRRAEIWQLSKPREWREIKTEKLPRGRIEFYTHKELKKILTELDGLWLRAVWLGAKAGLRPAEIYHQNQDTINIKDRKIIVRPTECFECPEKFHPKGLWTPKVGKSRIVTMKEDLADYLRRRNKRVKEWLISEEYSGWRPTFAGFTHTLGNKLQALTRKGSAYTLRHTYATHEVQSGVDIRRIRDEMGHDSITTTEIYLHQPPACDCAPPCAPSLPNRAIISYTQNN